MGLGVAGEKVKMGIGGQLPQRSNIYVRQEWSDRTYPPSAVASGQPFTGKTRKREQNINIKYVESKKGLSVARNVQDMHVYFKSEKRKKI